MTDRATDPLPRLQGRLQLERDLSCTHCLPVNGGVWTANGGNGLHTSS
jgi:hypothetical protein